MRVSLGHTIRILRWVSLALRRRTHTWIVGAQDLSGLISSNRELRKRLAVQQRKAATRMQAFCRGVIARGFYAVLVEEKRRMDELHYRMASKIAAAYRGHLDRRAAHVERCLKRIRNTSRILLAEAMRKRKGVKVFWYKRKEELKLLYRDYRLLVSRLGNDPPLHRVELNIHRIYENVDRIEGSYATLIQKHFRGVIGRTFIRELRAEKFYLFAKKNAAAFTIQKSVRGWNHRRFANRMDVLHRRESYVERFHKEVLDRRRLAERKRLREQVTRNYVHGRKLQNMARLLGKVPYARSRAEIYRDGTSAKLDLDRACNHMLAHDLEMRQEEASQALAHSKRSVFAHVKRLQHDAYAAYFTPTGGGAKKKTSNFKRELERYRRMRTASTII